MRSVAESQLQMRRRVRRRRFRSFISLYALVLGACCVWGLCRTGDDVHGPVVWSLSHTKKYVQAPGKKWFGSGSAAAPSPPSRPKFADRSPLDKVSFIASAAIVGPHYLSYELGRNIVPVGFRAGAALVQATVELATWLVRSTGIEFIFKTVSSAIVYVYEAIIGAITHLYEIIMSPIRYIAKMGLHVYEAIVGAATHLFEIVARPIRRIAEAIASATAAAYEAIVRLMACVYEAITYVPKALVRWARPMLEPVVAGAVWAKDRVGWLVLRAYELAMMPVLLVRAAISFVASAVSAAAAPVASAVSAAAASVVAAAEAVRAAIIAPFYAAVGALKSEL